MKAEITESRSGEIVTITDIDLASVLRYFGFSLVDSSPSKGKNRKYGKPLTEFRFLAAHPSSEHKLADIIRAYTNDTLSCAPRKLLSESRHLRNLAHQREHMGVSEP